MQTFEAIDSSGELQARVMSTVRYHAGDGTRMRLIVERVLVPEHTARFYGYEGKNPLPVP